MALLGVFALLGVAAFHFAANQVLDKVDRVADPFAAIKNRPKPTQGLTILLAGLDDRSAVPLTGSGAENSPGGRTDSIMLVRLPADRSAAYVVSLPRDSWVDIPDHGRNKLNAAFALGGPTLLIRTVENLTNLRVDHLALVDWDGFKALTDALGGVEIDFPTELYDTVHKIRFPAGKHVLDGSKALWYVRQRYGLPRGDLDRMQHQQNFLRALMTKIQQSGTFSDPSKITALVRLATDHVTVDQNFSNDDLLALALDAPKLRGNVRFVTAPIQGFATIAGESVVVLDPAKEPAFFTAVGTDHLPDYLANNKTDQLGANA